MIYTLDEKWKSTRQPEKRREKKQVWNNKYKIGKALKQGLFYHKGKGELGKHALRIPPPSHPGESRRWISPPPTHGSGPKTSMRKKVCWIWFILLVHTSSVASCTAVPKWWIFHDSSWFLIPIINVADWNANAHSDFNQGKTAKGATSSNGIIFYPLVIHSWSTDPPQCHPDLPKSCPILVIQWDDLFKDVAVNTQEIVVSWNLQRICQRDLL